MLNKILNLEGVTVLDKKQQKLVNGGEGGCGAYIPAGQSGNTTSFEPPNGGASTGSNKPTVFYDISYAEAQSVIQGVSGARWCCASCSTASSY
ncbi:hypothetical protein OOZ15_19350 [Galbibacter sp. EGI 63066]|uniref:hypothetical protein n=1 Tax=Galbibacter sp. EGI 63066 TaxID=2993559 RepID=UPI002248D861|nr:hypothetical protein [Galbibacter sp. EGI 63066]MCX2682115.1 hypothetical protein [Galbibacter sp. EGI 63066]